MLAWCLLILPNSQCVRVFSKNASQHYPLTASFPPLPPSAVDPPTIAVNGQPTSLPRVVPGDPASFTVMASSQDGILSYQWQKDGANIPTGATSATYDISSVMEDDEGMYSCLVSNAAGTVNSTAASLTVCKFILQAISQQLV